MCTLVILRRPDERWPLLLAANRDEMLDRPWKPPARHWPDRPEVTAGLDVLAGGSWLGLNDHGVAAGILNRIGSLGPAAGKRSRGELVLDALDHADAAAAADALGHLDAGAYRPFNMVIADNRDAYWIRARPGAPGERIEVSPIPEGLHMVTAHDMDDESSRRIRLHRARFAAAAAPDPNALDGDGDWSVWEALLASREGGGDNGHEGAMNIFTDWGFGTVSSSLIALPAAAAEDLRPVFRFSPGRPDSGAFEPISI